VTVDYIANVDQIENTSKLYSKIYFYTKVGQLGDTFDINENVFLRIYQKYLLNYTAYHQQLLSINKLNIEAVPGTVVYVRDSYDDTYFKHEIGPTGSLEFYDEDAIVTGIKFFGIQLYEANAEYLGEDTVLVLNNEDLFLIDDKDKSFRFLLPKQEMQVLIDDSMSIDEKQVITLNNDYYKIKENMLIIREPKDNEVKDNEFRAIKNFISRKEIVTNPIKNGVYTIDGIKYIWYRSQWYEFSDDNIVQCSVDALIDYIYELMRGEY
jgi:hypothetical protein